jgi:hypothetical protein
MPWARSLRSEEGRQSLSGGRACLNSPSNSLQLRRDHLYGHANTQRSTQMHAKIISTRLLKYQAKLPMNRQSGEGGVRRHCATESRSPIGHKSTSESFRKYTMTRGHGFEIFVAPKTAGGGMIGKIKILCELKIG